MRRLFFWRRPEVWALVAASVLFLAGALNLASRNRRSEERSKVATSPSATVTGGAASIGPAPGEAVPAYVERKKSLLVSRAGKSPWKASHAVISFGTYVRAADAEKLAGKAAGKVSAIQIRVPHPGQERREVNVTAGIDAAVKEALDGLIKETEQELRDLEELIPTVDDPSFKRVYQEDVKAHKDLLFVLRSDPPVLFAVVLRSTYGLLRDVQAREGVRLVDLPEDPNVTPTGQPFPGLLPEQS